MPTSQHILDGLEALANEWRTMAVAWHALAALALLALLLGWRPTRRLAGTLLALPLASVAVLAWVAGNPFNGTAFAVLTAALLGAAARLPGVRVAAGARWQAIAGGVLVVFAWVYPHFLSDTSWTTYLYAAPLGLIPCPTLSMAIGFALIAGGLGSRVWSLVLASGGAFYGLVGWLRLGVIIDMLLLAGAVALGSAAAVSKARAGSASLHGSRGHDGCAR